MANTEELETQLAEKLVGHYGYLAYIRHGVVIPGSALIAPAWCEAEHFGDCDVIAKAVVDHLMAAGEVPHILLAKLPWATPGEEENRWLQHTMVCQGEMAQGNLHWWGYSPYDQLIAGRVGYLDINNLAFPLGIREQIPVDEFYNRYAGKIIPGFAYLNEQQQLVIDAVPGPGENVPCVAQLEVAKADLGTPAIFDPATGVFVELTACAGRNSLGIPIVGYKCTFNRDSFDTVLQTDARAEYFVVTTEDLLPELIGEVRDWEPSQTITHLLCVDHDAGLAEVRTSGVVNFGLIEEAVATMGESLYWLIVNSSTGGASSLAAFDRLKQPKPTSP